MPGEQPKYPECTAGEHVAERSRVSYAGVSAGSARQFSA
jgi:hypothetical protein